MVVKISIAMATYNGEQFISEQLNSLAQQTVLPHELVITDDQSTDRTVEMIESFAETSPFPVRLHINSVRLGYADNFLKAASLCEGDFVAFCDQDDVWVEEKLEKLETYLSRPKISLVTHSFQYVDRNLQTLRSLQNIRFPSRNRVVAYLSNEEMFFKKDGGFNRFGIGFTLTCRRSVVLEALRRWQKIANLRGEQRAGSFLGHDDLVLCVAGGLGMLACLPSPLVKYRQHGSNTASSRGKKNSTEVIADIVKTGYVSYSDKSAWHREKAEILSSLAELKGDAGVSEALKSLARLHESRAETLQLRSRVYDPSLGRFARLSLLVDHIRNRSYLHKIGFRAIVKDALFSILGPTIAPEASLRASAERRQKRNGWSTPSD